MNELTRKVMIERVIQLQATPQWGFFCDYLDDEIDTLLGDLEAVSQDKSAYIILGKIKALRGILHLDLNSINIMMNSTPHGPVGD